MNCRVGASFIRHHTNSNPWRKRGNVPLCPSSVRGTDGGSVVCGHSLALITSQRHFLAMETSVDWILSEQARLHELRNATNVLLGEMTRMMDQHHQQLSEWYVKMQEFQLLSSPALVKEQQVALAQAEKAAKKAAKKEAELLAKRQREEKKRLEKEMKKKKKGLAASSAHCAQEDQTPPPFDFEGETETLGDPDEGKTAERSVKLETPDVPDVAGSTSVSYETSAEAEQPEGDGAVDGDMSPVESRNIDFAQFCANKEQAEKLQREYDEEQATQRLIAQIQNEEREMEEEAERRRLAQERELAAMRQRGVSDSMVAGALGPIECPICIDEIDVDFSHPIDGCGHVYCRDCIVHYVTDAINNKNLPIACPDPQCGGELSMYDIEMLVDRDLYVKFTEFSLATLVEANPEYSCCPTADCKYIFIHQSGDPCRLNCPACKNSYCLDCKCDWHEGVDCKAYQAWAAENKQGDQLFNDFATGARYKQCPACGVWVEKVPFSPSHSTLDQ